jgi:plasmanylethanolamine desaturase
VTTGNGYGGLQRRLEAAAIAVWAVMTLALAFELVSNLVAGSWAFVAVGSWAGLVAADLLSGLVHWSADTWGRSDLPILGPAVIRGFREHHADPDAILSHDFIETNGASSAGSLLPLTLAFALPLRDEATCMAYAGVLSLSTALFATNQIHKWAHSARPPVLVAWLQRHGCLLRPSHHAVHHSRPFDRNYCITTGWLNPLCERLRLFETLEGWVSACCGAVPRRHDVLPRDDRAVAQ